MFRTDRPPTWQVCLSCGNEAAELDPHPRCASCGGLLEVRHRGPRLSRVEATHEMCGAACSPSEMISSAVASVPSRVEPPAP